MKWSEDIKTSCLNEHFGSPLLNCSCGITPTHADICFINSVALGSVLAACYTQVPHRSTLYQHSSASGIRWCRRVIAVCSYRWLRTAANIVRSRITNHAKLDVSLNAAYCLRVPRKTRYCSYYWFIDYLHTLDNKFQVNGQSIGSHSNRRPISTRDIDRYFW